LNTQIAVSNFGKTLEGKSVEKYHLKNTNGVVVDVITYGGIITSLQVPDRKGAVQNIVLGYKTISDYEKFSPYFGAIIGRYANRIAQGKFCLNGTEFPLAINNNHHHLHGGHKGFDKAIWHATPIENTKSSTLKLTYLSKDMEEGYPGNLATTVCYTLTEDNTLEITYSATTDATTVVNLTQHSYFNLSGNFKQTILDHEVVIDADAFLPISDTKIPTGEFKPVAHTAFNFKKPKPIGVSITEDDDQLIFCEGYDHNWVLNNYDTNMHFAASAYHKDSGRLLEVFTTAPGIQFFTDNFLGDIQTQKGEQPFINRSAFCFETQHFPDSPNHSNFPSVVLHVGDTYKSATTFKFSIK